MSALAVIATGLAIPAAALAAVTPQATRPAAPAGAITVVSCSGPATCIGLGAFEPAQSTEYFLQTWNGTTWSASFGSFPNSKNYELADLWCSSPSHCVAVGNTNADGNGRPAPLAATWNGSTWSVTKAPGARHSAQGSQFTALSCSSPKFCVATGSYTRPVSGPTVPPFEGFADVWNGTKWSLSSQLSPKGASYLAGVSCLSAHSCVAAGGTYTPYTLTFLLAKTAKPFIERWNGRKWIQAEVPVPARGHGQLNDVSCWSAKGCAAVGFYYRHGSTLTSPLAEKWNGRAWKGTTPKAPGYSPAFYEVSCVSARSCLAVGNGNNGGPNTKGVRAIANAWNGSGWKTVHVQIPSQASGKRQGDFLAEVSCASATECLAIGAYGPFEGTGVEFFYPFAEAGSSKGLKPVSDS